MNKKNYSVLSNLKYSLGFFVFYMKKSTLFIGVMDIVIGVAIPFVSVFIPSIAIYYLTGDFDVNTSIIVIISSIVIFQLISILSVKLEKTFSGKLFFFRLHFTKEYSDHIIDMDYEAMESTQGRKQCANGLEMVYMGNEDGIEAYLRYFFGVVKNLLGLVISIIITYTLHPLIVVFLILSSVGVIYFNDQFHKFNVENEEFNAAYYARNQYLEKTSIDPKNIKDIKLYSMQKWIASLYERLINDRKKYIDVYFNIRFKSTQFTLVSTFLKDIIVYLYLIYCLFQNTIDVPYFIMYVGVISTLSNWLIEVFNNYKEFIRNDIVISNFRNFKQYGKPLKSNGKSLLKNEAHSITLENVSFKYSDNDKYSIDNLSLEIKKGEKLAIVGANGAGKTTLVKLICGLYTPTKGRILIDGIDCATLCKDQIFKEFSVVFQDEVIFAFDVESNVTGNMKSKTDYIKLEQALKQAGIYDKIESLPNNIKQNMTKRIYEDGVEFSGGESSKLMLARALYNDAPVMILDEPTSALDPIAESILYESYNQLIENKTSIFISHRLSSTRFCDRIILLNDGSILEIGTHEQLMNKGGAYHNMFDIQSHYYKKSEVKNND